MESYYSGEYGNEPRDFTSDYDPDVPDPIGNPFVVQWTDGTFSTKSERWVSDTFDMADCDYGEGVSKILAADENGNLVPVHMGESRKINEDQEFPLHYARSRIYAGTRVVGHVTYSDH